VAEELGLEQVLGDRGVLIATNGPAARGLCRCSARATSSLPVPDSPVMSTVAFDCDRRLDRAKHFPHRRCLPEHFGGFACRRFWDRARGRFRGRASDQRERMVDIEGLRQIFEGAPGRRRPRFRDPSMPS
jgi:hypothetical protein